MERNLQTDNQLDWPEIVASAKRRRHEMKLKQRRLAAAAGVSLPTVVRFEAGQDIRAGWPTEPRWMSSSRSYTWAKKKCSVPSPRWRGRTPLT